MLPSTAEAAPSPLEQFSTRRLVARQIRIADYADIRRLHLHPQLMKTLSADGQILPDNVTADGVAHDLAHWREHGFGLWVFRDCGTGWFVGRGGLKWYTIEGRPVVGLSYSVVSDLWGHGLATEIGAASLGQGFRRLGLGEVASWTLPSNLASQRVMEKLGFRFEAEVVFAGLLHRLYRLTALDWAMGRGAQRSAS
jgi:RimJ/RimL family protein N-acetyltransferase